RLVDAAIYSSLTWWLVSVGRWRAAAVALSCIVTAFLVPYVRARAETLGLHGQIGFAHRFNRLRITAIGTLVTGLSTPTCMEITLWVLSISAAVTTVQRVMLVAHQTKARIADTTASGGAVMPDSEQSRGERHHADWLRS